MSKREPSLETDSPLIRPAVTAEAEAIAHIATLSLPNPWGVDLFRAELERPWSHVWVLEPHGGSPPVAFINFWKVADEIHVLNFATIPSARRSGFARHLLAKMQRFAAREGVSTISLEVRASNEPAIRLYASFGFEQTGVRRCYYADNGEDAIVMCQRL